MRQARHAVGAGIALALVFAACGAPDGEGPETSKSAVGVRDADSAPAPTSDPTPTEGASMDTVIIGTVIRFTAASGGMIDVTIDEDNPAVRDLLTMLPLTLSFEDFAGNEKIAYPLRDIRTAGSPPSSAGTGDLAIYVPWGNIAFFYSGERGTPSADIVHLGVFDASSEQLEALEEGDVTVAIVD
ncbi:cyclophilin-like fold protein [Saccharomonospora sp. NPDC046836]|uniref:cyclophilin-like fold protein n=1 Tax=Saccharomonospora sp. NPDC046836 TaxID=3156921 RepID=UPI0033F5A7F5